MSSPVFLVKKIKGYMDQLFDLYLIGRSELFDKEWYLNRNPDIAIKKINPLRHYFRYGGFEGLDPSANFCSSYYLEKNEDVKRSGMNPLAHFLKYGKAEGRLAQPKRNILKSTGKQKVFCIGFNKTGTTSIELALKDFGYNVGIQADAEVLMDDWAVRDFRRIVQYCETADAFQDVPFSLDFTYPILDHIFPGSKFILTVRNDAGEWYRSLVRFHAQLIGVAGTPSVDDLKKFTYRGEGWLLRQQKNIFGVDESRLYDENIYKTCYEKHNAQILEYFRHRPKDLLVLNLSDPSAMQSLCEFLNVKYVGQLMPHLNRSGT